MARFVTLSTKCPCLLTTAAATGGPGSQSVQVLGMPALAEIFLEGNRIGSLEGMSSLGVAIEVAWPKP